MSMRTHDPDDFTHDWVIKSHHLLFCDCCTMAIEGCGHCECPEGDHPDGLGGTIVKMDIHPRNIYQYWDAEENIGIYDFSWNPCDSCGTHLGGTRHRYLHDPEWIKA